MALIRTYSIQLHHDGGKVRFATAATSAGQAVRQILAAEHAPMGAVLSVSHRPTCNFCDQVATRYAKDGDDPLCKACAKDHYTSVPDSTGELGVRRFTVVPQSEWSSK